LPRYIEQIVCLANSRKHSGRCIAGKEVLPRGYGSWIRPISARPSAEISEEERRFENGEDPRVLDIIDVPLIAAVPMLHQTENHIIASDCYWTKKGRLPWAEVKHLIDTPAALWSNGDSTYYGVNDRVTVEQASTMTHSLLLIEPENPHVSVQTEGAEFGNPRRRVRANFAYQGVEYLLIVTDPVAERAFLAKPDGRYPLITTYLCVSLGEAHTDGYCYKLVAAVISKQLF
jgi:hypothetical protein